MKNKIKALVKLRCGNMKKTNKYWLEEKYMSCVFYRNSQDCVNYYVEECHRIRDWFEELDRDEKWRRIQDYDLDTFN